MLMCGVYRESTGDLPLSERQTSPSELGPENLDLSSFNGSYRMWRRLVHYLLHFLLEEY